MNCRACNYVLWNIRDRRCPECGTPFLPSEFKFVPGSVRFCCPRCAQAYYGTSAEGLLEPREFTCVGCGSPVNMDEMVLMPAEGVREEQTQGEVMPWLNPNRGVVSRWFGTIGWGMGTPARLIRNTPLESSVWRALVFAAVTTGIYTVVGLGFFVVFPMVAIGARRSTLGMLAGLATFLVIFLGAALGVILLWMLVSHALLRLGRRTEGGLRRTAQCFCYASAGDVLRAVPCISIYMIPISWVWLAISSILMLRESQKVSALRACLAVLIPPLATIAALVFWIVLRVAPAIQSAISTARTNAAVAGATLANGVARAHAQNMLDALRATRGSPPKHGAAFAADGTMSAPQFVLGPGPGAETVPVGYDSLWQLAMAPKGEKDRELARAAAMLPKDVIAHRVGDFVFTYHGVDMVSGDPRLWLFIAEARGEKDDDGKILPSVWLAGQNHGDVREIGDAALPAALALQNQVRTENGLAPLPMPDKVTHGKPAAASQPPPRDPGTSPAEQPGG